tara:strand:+ start:26954 stop:27544 length:591 start_codon:yes stop_codon:yes gene_type:complete
MALPSTGELALTDIQTEFGGSNPIGLSEYYAGGLYVPSGTTGDGGAIPTTGEITIGDFYGSQSGITITVTEGSLVVSVHTGYGFNTTGALTDGTYSSNYGSVSPTTYEGATIWAIVRLVTKYINNPPPGFYVVLSGNRAQNFFTSIDVQGYGTLLSSNATRTYLTGNPLGARTMWGWAGVQPSGWDGTGTSTVLFI